MRNSKYRHLIIAAGGFLLLAAGVLWSFNTLAELFGGPHAQFKHAVAGIALLVILKWCISANRGNRIENRWHRRSYQNSPGNVHEQ